MKCLYNMCDELLCKSCGLIKPLIDFSTYKIKCVIKIKNSCKVCISLYNKNYRANNKIKIADIKKKWFDENREKVLERVKNYRKLNITKLTEQQKLRYITNKDEIIRKNTNYVNNNKEKVAKNKKLWGEKNKDILTIKRKQYWSDNKNTLNKKGYIRKKERLKNDIFFKFKENIRNCIYNSLYRKGYNKKSKTHEILGCSFEEFKIYIESKFQPWMNWDNHGNPKDGVYELNKTWDIDHIEPLFNAKTVEDVIRLNHYTNFQPLCTYTNRFIKRNN